MVSLISVPGFNTDIKWQNRVYHVQTENLNSQQQVESLIFAGGEILAAKRTSYLDHDNPLEPAEIAAFLHHQHRVITAVIKSGLIDELQQRETVKELEGLVVLSPEEEPKIFERAKPEAKPSPPSEPISLNLMDEVFGKIEPKQGPHWKSMGSMGSQTMEMLAHLEKSVIESAQAHTQTENGDSDFKTLGEGGAEPLTTAKPLPQPVVANTKLTIQVYGREEFFAGDQGPLQIVVKSEDSSLPIKNAEVTVRLVGTAFRPMLWKQTTGADGLAIFDFAIPTFNSGTGAFIIDAVTEEGECQQRFAIRKARPDTEGLHPVMKEA